MAALEEDADHVEGTAGTQKPRKYYRAESLNDAHHKSKPSLATATHGEAGADLVAAALEGPAAVVAAAAVAAGAAAAVAEGSTAGPEEGRERRDKTAQKTLVRLELMKWDLDTRRLGIHHRRSPVDQAQLEDDLPKKGGRASRFAAGAERQGGTHSNGDVSDSHCLEAAETGDRLGHRKGGPRSLEVACRSQDAAEGNSGHAWAGPEAGRGHRRWPAGLGEDILGDRPVEEAWLPPVGDAGRRCGPGRTLALATKPV